MRYIFKKLYTCPLCNEKYRGNWFSRHLTEKHGQAGYDYLNKH